MHSARPLLRRVARVVSTLFIPPFLFFFIVLLASQNLLYGREFTISWVTALLFGTLAPIVYFIVMVRRGKIVNQDAERKEERTVPYLVGAALLILGVLCLSWFGIGGGVLLVWYAYIGNSLLITVINRFWKISAHAMGAAAPIALALHFGIPVIFFYFVLAAVCWSRLQLKVHTPLQVLFGALAGFFSVALQLLLFSVS